MRITNKIMQNNTLTNININKNLQNKLSHQMSTQKLLTRPSDDPVVAIRSLRLRTNVTEVTQFYKKNAPDAQSWLSVTQDALNTTLDVMTNMRSEFTTGANGDLTSSDRAIIMDSLKALRDEVYATGNVDFAGRYIFTGYRTGETLTFTDETTQQYSITEQVTSAALDTITHVNSADLMNITAGNVATNTTTQLAVSSGQLNRLQLSYKECDDAAPVIEYAPTTGTDGNVTWQSLNTVTLRSFDTITWQQPRLDGNGDPVLDDSSNPIIDTVTGTAYDFMLAAADGSVTSYTDANDNTVDVADGIFLKDTGEILLSDNAYTTLSSTKDDLGTEVNEAEIRVTYEKSTWRENDLRPEHYFACTTDSNVPAKAIAYNQSYLSTGNVERQVIAYDVGYNQTIRVNTTADEGFDPAVVRVVDDVLQALEDVTKMEQSTQTIEKALEGETDESKRSQLQTTLDAAQKAMTYLNDKLQSLFESGITKMQDFINAESIQITEVGTRLSRLDLVTSRLSGQKTTFETLQSANEDADITEVAIQLSSANLTYTAALQATAKIAQTTLLNYL
ncbi:MAG: hypothetical protein K6A92_06455 [Lachnospiraceae bacterium]|nr:hypothetical protein [Lachnospiraceae bacterium]